MKTREDKEFTRRMAYYDERIESAKSFLIEKVKDVDAVNFVVCRASTYEPVALSSTGAVHSTSYSLARLFNSQDDAGRFAVRCNERDRSAIYVVLRLSTAINYHVEWLKNRKSSAAKLRGQMVAARNKARLQKTVDTRPWWKRIA